MSPSEENRLVKLRREALPYLKGTLFDDVVAEAKQYHIDHPPLEGVIDNGKMPEKGARAVEAINHETRLTLIEEHRGQTMQPFIRKGIPIELAGELVDAFVFAE